jgi:tRNA (cytidine/uridine-2'-O-)-methyltransferase
MRIALYQPDIPQNTGTILRLAACLNIAVDIILPAGFDLSDRNLRRAGMDYLDQVSLTRHAEWAAFETWRHAQTPKPRLVLLSSKAQIRHVDAAFRPDDILLLGRESAGAPPTVHQAADLAIRIPMHAQLRSLNIAVAAALVAGEALRQLDGFATD